MIARVIDVSERPARIRLETGVLRITPDDGAEASVPLDEVAALVLGHPQVTVSQPALGALAAAGAAVIVCDERRLPVGLLLPLVGNTVQTERFRRQAECGAPTRKRIWREIVRAKVLAQGRLLEELGRPEPSFEKLARRVRSGDTGNVEALASRWYWHALFGGGFRRDRDGPPPNNLLNYGYAILRGATARAVAAAGLHPTLGVHHHNRYDAYCLADDLMEPYRPLVDRAVYRLMGERGGGADLDGRAKAHLVAAVMARYRSGGESRTLIDILARAASALACVLCGDSRSFRVPEAVP